MNSRVKIPCTPGGMSAVGLSVLAGCERIFDLYRRVSLQSNFARQVQRGSFAIDHILRDAVEGGERNEQRRELGMIHHLEVPVFCPRPLEDSRSMSSGAAPSFGDGGRMIHDRQPTFTIFVEASADARVVTTRLRAMGSCTSPRFRKGCPPQIRDQLNRGEATSKRRLHQYHAGHVAGVAARIVETWRIESRKKRVASQSVREPSPRVGQPGTWRCWVARVALRRMPHCPEQADSEHPQSA